MRFRLTFVVALVAISAVAARAQQTPRGLLIAGTVRSVTASDIILTTTKGDIDISITPQTRVLVRESGNIGDIKAGVYLGTSNQNSADGITGTATEVHLMDHGPNVNYPMNNSGLTMTNGHVKAITPTDDGQEMDIDYGQGTTRHVVVKKDTLISKLIDVGVADLKPGLDVNALTTSGPGGKPMARNISIVTAAPKGKP